MERTTIGLHLPRAAIRLVSNDLLICFVDCSLPEIEFAVNGGRSVDSGVSLTVGDVLTCSAEGAVLYRWTNGHNGDGPKTYGKTLHISQAGSFIYKCTVFMDCETDSFCPFARNISGFAAGIIIALYISMHAKQW